GAEFCLIIGSDTLDDLPTWHQPERIVEMAELLVAQRPGWPLKSARELGKELKLKANIPRIREVVMPLIEISSRDVRRRLAEGRSVRYMIPRAVEADIPERRLYQ